MRSFYLYIPSILLCFALQTAFAQTNYDFGIAPGSSGRDEITDLAVDASGNVYLTGVFQDSIDVIDGTGEEYIKGGGWRDIFVGKYGPDGSKLWAFGIGDRAWDRGWALTTDNMDNVYVGGVFSGRADFDPSADSTILQANTAGVWPDGYIAKYSTDGDLLWAKHILTARNRSASQTATLFAIHSMDIDNNGDLLIGGAFWDSVYFDASTLLVSDGPLRDIFLAKYDSDGNLIWAQQMGGAADQEIHGLATGPQGNIYTTGYYFGTSDFDPSSGQSQLTSVGGADIFVAKYSSTGALDWVHGFGSADNAIVRPESGNDLGVDDQGNVYVTGIYYGAIDFDPGAGMNTLTPDASSDIFTLKFDSQGNLDWAFSLDGGAFMNGKGISVQGNGDFWMTGDFTSSPTVGLDLDPGPDTSAIFSLLGTFDIFVANYQQDGSFLDGWLVRGLDGDNVEALDANSNHLAIGGMFERTILLNPQTGDLRFSKGDFDMFAMKWGADAMGIRDRLPAGILSAYPNPASDHVQIDAQWTSPQTASLRLMNLQGQVLESSNYGARTNLNVQLNVEAYPAGMYLVELLLPEGRAIEKLIIEK